jgi:regulator of protease activity HflC (stomatin/prohibitin superfamily)
MTTEPISTKKLMDPLGRLYRLAVIMLVAVVIAALLFGASRAAIYKIHEYERGLHLRGGRFLAVDEPGWHWQIPYVDTVIFVKVNERLGYVERISAATADNLTMLVSLQYTYRVTEARTFALEVDDPERILFEFVQGKLRDVVNQQTMADMMNARAAFSDVMLSELRTKEAQYGVQFVTVQIQSAEPPANVVQAIEDLMVATQREAQASAEAAQQKIKADAELYTAHTQADAEAYQIEQRALAQKQSVDLLLGALSQHPDIASKYLDYLMTQELKSNSKWIIGQPGLNLQLGSETTP